MPDLPAPHTTLLRRVAGLSAPVDRGFYWTTGITLLAGKFAVEAAAIYAVTGTLVTPLVYLTPFATLKLDVLGGAEWLGGLLILWTLPFAWVGLTMSIRRARDAGLPPAFGLLFLVPFVNLLAIATLGVLQTSPDQRTAPPPPLGPQSAPMAALVGVTAGAFTAVPVTAISTLLLGDYGATLFVGGPVLMSAIAAYLYNLRADRGAWGSVAVGLLTQGVAAGFLLLTALEGVICLIMAAPLAAVLGTVGGLIGRSLARVHARRELAAPLLVFPALFAVEQPHDNIVQTVSTTVEIDAPTDAVWAAIVHFEQIPEDDRPGLLYEAGVAWPTRADVVGEGVGATRTCEFSTGTVLETVTAWEPGRRLAFDITDAPPLMEELSPWPRVHAPHIVDGTFQSRTGEFLLEPLPGGRTRLTGTSTYTLDMAPLDYWSTLSDQLVKGVHRRVFRNIARQAAGG